MARRKFYVVFKGYQPGVYDSWEECKAQVEGFAGAKYKSYDSCESATNAFRKEMDVEEMKFYTFLTQEHNMLPDYSAFPDICVDAIAVDAACNKNPGGDVEYRGVWIRTGQELFRVGPFPGGSNNIGEYLAIVHALGYLAKQGPVYANTPIYSDSVTALSWIRKRSNKSTVQLPPDSKLAQMLARADLYVATHAWLNPIYKWDTDRWGEIPADFGRK